MQITDPLANSQLSADQSKGTAAEQLKAGQRVQATVADVSRNGLVELKIGDRSILTRSSTPVTPGESLTLEVIKGGNRPELMVLRTQNTESTQTNSLRTLLPKQGNIQQLIDLLKTLPVGNQPRNDSLLQQLVQLSSLGIKATATNTPGVTANAPGTTAQATSGQTPALSAQQKIVQVLTEALLLQKNTSATASATTNTASGSTPTTAAQNAQILSNALAQLLDTKTTSILSQLDKLPLPANTEGSVRQNIQYLAQAVARAIASPGTAASNPMPDAVRQSPIAQQIESVLTHAVNDRSPATAERLQQLFINSGLFLESNLARGVIPPPTDLKNSLLRMLFHLKPMEQTLAARSMEPLPGQGQSSQTPANLQQSITALLLRLVMELHSQTEGALARLQLHQLASVPRDDSTQMLWQFELPVQGSDGEDRIGIQVEHDGSNSSDPEGGRWRVQLRFNIAPAGPVLSHLTLVEEEISANFTAETPGIAEKIEQLLPRLKNAFEAAGLKIGKLSAQQGNASEIATEFAPDSPLLDERA